MSPLTSTPVLVPDLAMPLADSRLVFRHRRQYHQVQGPVGVAVSLGPRRYQHLLMPHPWSHITHLYRLLAHRDRVRASCQGCMPGICGKPSLNTTAPCWTSFFSSCWISSDSADINGSPHYNTTCSRQTHPAKRHLDILQASALYLPSTLRNL